jgi:DNA-binding NarL/FixJ family response regulator
MVSVVIADDHRLIREGIKTILKACEEYKVVGEADDGELVLSIVEQQKPEILLLDISMPKRSGLDLIEQVHNLSPGTRIIIVSVHRAPLYITKALQTGVKGYLHKENAAEDLLPALKRVLSGGTYISAPVAEYLVDQAAQDPAQKSASQEVALTKRESDILRLVVEGKTAKEMAELLLISSRTVENHKQALLKKLDLHRTSDLIKYAITHGIVEAGDS